MSRRQWLIEKALPPTPSIAMSPGGSSAVLSCVSRRHCRHHPHWPWPRRSAARPDGIPRSWAGLRMSPTYQFEHTNGFRAQRFRCPLLFPTRTGQTCKHAQFVRGPGCVKDPNWEQGGLIRALLDRSGPLYKPVYMQRTRLASASTTRQRIRVSSDPNYLLPSGSCLKHFQNDGTISSS